MGIFTRSVKSPKFSSAPIQGAAAGYGRTQVNNFMNYSVGNAEERALSIPTISRSRDLIASMIGSLELKHYSEQWNGESYDEVYLPREPWMDRPDPKVTRNFFFANIFSDLFFHGRAFAFVTSRYSTGLPATFTWIPTASITTPNQNGPQFFGEADTILFNGQEINKNDVIQFLSPIQGLLYQGARATSIAIHLDQAADRYATLETVPGYLQQKGGETMDGESLGDLAAAWAAARRANAIGALNDYVEFVEYKKDPSEVLQSSREYQALELARIANIPPYLVGIATGGMTYQNAQQARQDLYLFGARPYLDCIEQTLSMNNVLPRNRYVEFDIDSYLMDNNMAEMPSTPTGVPND